MVARKSIAQIRAEDAARRAKFAADEAKRQKAIAAAKAKRDAAIRAKGVPKGSVAAVQARTFIPEITTVVKGGPSKSALQRARARQGRRGERIVQKTAARRGRQTTTTTITERPVIETRNLRISQISSMFGEETAIQELRFRAGEKGISSGRRAKLQRQADFFGFDLGGRALKRPKAAGIQVITVGAEPSRKTRRLVRAGRATIAPTATKRGGGRRRAQRRRRTKRKRRRR